MALTKIPSNLITLDAIDGTLIADNAIDSEHITNGSIDAAHMSANSIDSDSYVDGSIDTAHIGDDQVTAAKLANAINTSISEKAPLASPTFTGTVTGAGPWSLTHGSTPYLDLKVGSTMKGRFYADANQAIIEAVGNSLILKSASTTALTFNSSQAATFAGAATVGGTLGVTGTTTITADTSHLRLAGATTATKGLALLFDNSNNRSEIRSDQAGVNQLDLMYYALDHHFGRNASNITMTLTDDNKVGIGTSSPSYVLHTKSSDSINTWLQSTHATDCKLQFSSATTDDYSRISAIAGVLKYEADIASAVANSGHQWTVDGGEKMRIDISGRLLVGQTSAVTNGKLQVTGGIGLTGNSEIRSSTNSDNGDTIKFFGTQFVAGTNSHSYSYSEGGYIASLGTAGSAILLDVGNTTANTGHRFRVINAGNGVDGSLQYLDGTTVRLHVDSSTGIIKENDIPVRSRAIAMAMVFG